MACISQINKIVWAKSPLILHSRHFAARRGTRAKMDKKKKTLKVEEKKIGFIPHNLREKALGKTSFTSRRVNYDYKPLPENDVWIAKYHRMIIYDFNEAIKCHKETHHPQIYNQPDAYLNAFIELDMRTSKKTKFVDGFTRTSKVDYPFPLTEVRSVLVFCKTPELKEEAESAGATLVGDSDLIKKIEKGEFVLPDFTYVLAHPNILTELVALRGLLKRKFPNPKSGSLGLEIGSMVKRFKSGIQYTAFRDENESDYGWVETAIGTVDMEPDHLKANFQNLINDISLMRPKREGLFITRVFLQSPPSVEKLKINIEPFLPDEFKKDAYESDSDDEKAEAL